MIIGLTGSMAAGKSTVSAMLKELGFYIIDADKTAHAAIETPEVRQRIIEVFGDDILSPDGRIDRRLLAEKAFASAEKTAELNAIIHPAVIETMLEDADWFSLEYPEIPVVFDVPLLFESGMDKFCDRILTVAADDEIRYLRIMLRDGLTREAAARRVEKQMPQEEKIARSDAAVWNNKGLAELRANLLSALAAIGCEPLGDYENDDNDGA